MDDSPTPSLRELLGYIAIVLVFVVIVIAITQVPVREVLENASGTV